MRSICFFSSYFTGSKLPYYVKVYLEELTGYFSEVVLITNEKEIGKEDTDFLTRNKIPSMFVVNEGYDFGMWYKAILKYDVTNYDRVGLVNDSCILFGKLDIFFRWLEKENPDFAGFTDSYLIEYHLQSYFLIINKSIIHLVVDYFNKTGIVKDVKDVIKRYEIGLSSYLLKKGKSLKAQYTFSKETGAYNNALVYAKNLINSGAPLIKRKIISREYRHEAWRNMVISGFDPFPSNYIRLIRKKNNRSDLDGVFSEIKTWKGIWTEMKFNINCIAAILLRPLREQRYKNIDKLIK